MIRKQCEQKRSNDRIDIRVVFELRPHVNVNEEVIAIELKKKKKKKNNKTL